MALPIKKELFPQQFSTNIRLLVIDHDINLLNAIQNVCFKFHYPVKTCFKVSDALNLLLERKDSFDLVLIEAKMPDMDSYEFLRYVTQQINIPVIMMCADNRRSVVIKAIDDGACDYWTKPLCETLIQNMWQHVARKLWNKNKNLELSEDEFGMKRQEKYDSKLPLIDPKLEGVINTSVKQESGENNNDEPESSTKKARVKWSSELHKKFVNVVMELNVDKAVPKKILARMNEPGLTREHVASHLQKYKQFLKRGETKKQKKQNRIAEATETKISNGSSEFDFQAYNASIPRVVPNNLTPTSFPQQPNNLIPPVNAVPVNVVPVNAYQTDSEEETSSSASINQQNCSGFGTNSIINPSFLNALDARYPNVQVQNIFLAWHNPSTNSNDSTSSNGL